MSKEDKSSVVVTRFAPSPTGFMHVGNLRTGLFAWLWARKNNGTFILRIEDTDKKREVEGSIEHIQKTLKWIGLNWDQGPDIGGPFEPYIQSERMEKIDIYKKYAEKLIEKGYAYADTTTEEELDVLRKKAEEEKRPFLYRDHRPQNPPEWKPGIPLRFKVKELKRTTWHDVVREELSAGPEALDDFIMIKSDSLPTYNFANIVDDIEMGITHIFRGQEFISSTPNYIAVYEALGAEQPKYVTTPPILNATGNKKMGKRDGAKDALDYQKEGYLPEAIFNYLAFLGWNPGDEREVMSQDEIASAFDLTKIQKSGAKWSDEKLAWMNKEHMKVLPPEERNKQMQEWLSKNPEISKFEKFRDEAFMQKVYPIIFDRISKWGDMDEMVRVGELSYFFDSPDYPASQLAWKDSPTEQSRPHLEWVVNTLQNAADEDFSDPEKIKSLIFDYATEVGRGQVLWPTRVALSGKDKSPDPFTLIYILGKEESIKRLKSAIQKLSE